MSDLEGGSDEKDAQNTDKLLRVKFRDAYPRWRLACLLLTTVAQ